MAIVESACSLSAMNKLPSYVDHPSTVQPSKWTMRSFYQRLFKLLLLGIFAWNLSGWTYLWYSDRFSRIPLHAAQTLQKCRQLDVKPGPPVDFSLRIQSDRFVPGTKPTLLTNASIWTGRVNGLEIIEGDILLDKGLIKAVGAIEESLLESYEDLVTLDVSGAWVSPGIVDLHSHIGVDSAPALQGASDTNSRKGLIQPWLRSLDGLNTHDDAYRLSMSGGVTTSLVLPGSANAIGGQGFVIKLRPTAERSPSSMLLEPPYSLNGTDVDLSLPPRWRQMKHACGENPSRVYSGTRMDTIWAFREGYDTARKIKEVQDNYCSKALAGQWEGLGNFPEDLQWEALVDVLRGRVKVQTHCYETVDLDGLVRLSNEFKFPIAAFHHAHETYLVPDLLKQTYGDPPAVALFATNARYKREAYRGSEFAPRILAENGLQVVMKSDHPVLNSRHLLYEAQQAHYYGLPSNLALAAVTTTPAEVMGQAHRIGFIKQGYDADVVVWDSHPLSLGAAPKQVWIDGVQQIESPYVSAKPSSVQRAPRPPNFDEEAAEALRYEGLPPLEPKKVKERYVVFTNISSIFTREESTVRETYSVADVHRRGVVFVRDGVIVCSGTMEACSTDSANDTVKRIDLEGGSISPALVTFGSPLGLQEIQGESSTYDGWVADPLTQNLPHILDGDPVRAVDGLQFSGRDALLAYRAGVSTGIVAPKSAGFVAGFGTAFNTGAAHKLEKGAVIQEVAGLHVTIQHVGVPSVSTQVTALRRLLLGHVPEGNYIGFRDVSSGNIPLVVEVHNADIMASLIQLKREVEEDVTHPIKMTFTGATEAHLIAKEIATADIGIVVAPARPFPSSFESKRIFPGPPLTESNAVASLLALNITVGIGIEEQWSARSTRFDMAWTALEANSGISKAQAIALASVNLQNLLGVNIGSSQSDLVATRGGSLLDFESKVVAVISPSRGSVSLV